jgi:hypothetical protein
MKINKLMLAAVLTVTAGVAGLTPARADTTIDFSPFSNSDIGASATFTGGGITITAAGFSDTTFNTPVHLYSKGLGGDENGLGLINDPSTNHEISGTSLIRIALPAGLTNFSFTMGSTTGGEGWLVFGSNSATTGYTQVASGTDELNHVLLGPADLFYYFAFNPADVSALNTNVLLTSVDFVSTVPLPAALPLFASGLCGLGLLARRRKRKAAVVAV